MSDSSKNQRSRPKAKQKVRQCSEQHELIRVQVVPGFKGRARLEWRCNIEGRIAERVCLS